MVIVAGIRIQVMWVNFDQRKKATVGVSREFELSEFELTG